MSSKEQAWVSIHLDKERRLKLDANAICSFEEAMGMGIGDALTSGKFASIRGLLWACLLRDDPALERAGSAGIRKVGELIELAPGEALEQKVDYIKEKIGEAATLAYQGTKKEIGGTLGATS
jgi:hypothetical protein